MKISGGIYLIADAALDRDILLTKLTQALRGGIKVLQLYNTENNGDQLVPIIEEMCELCHQFNVPVLVNNNYRLLKHTLMDGVHFDKLPADFSEIQKQVGRNFLKGITCSNDLDLIHLANKYEFDYISFCSMFPSNSTTSCEIVSFATVKKARLITGIPFFVAGGISLGNLDQLSVLPLQGIALISGIMKSQSIVATTEKYVDELNKIINSDTHQII